MKNDKRLAEASGLVRAGNSRSLVLNYSPFTIYDSRPFKMTDVHDKKTRSFNMSRIRSKDTKPEMLDRKFLYGVIK